MKIFNRCFILIIFFNISCVIAQNSPDKPVVESIESGEQSGSAGIIFRDDFEDGIPLGNKYFDYGSNGGSCVLSAETGFGGSGNCVKTTWATGQVGAGGFMYLFGRNPVASLSHTNQDFNEIYWRFYIRMSHNWQGNPYKLTRATIFAKQNWAQAMVAHVWGENTHESLEIDPVSGIQNNQLVTTEYNDFANFTWLGRRVGSTKIYNKNKSESWFCVEAHVKLNSPGNSDGIFEIWIDDSLQARRNDLDFVGTWQDYKINGILFGNYWNGGSPRSQKRFFDNLVIAQNKIGLAISPLNPNIYKSKFRDQDGDTQSNFEAQVSQSKDDSHLVWQGSQSGESSILSINSQTGTFSGMLANQISLIPNKIYFVRVRQTDSSGLTSLWSDWKIFKTKNSGSGTIPIPPQQLQVSGK